MKPYRQPLAKRRRDSAYHVGRYWSDPAFRLAKINRDRVRRGRPTIASLDEVAQGWSRQPVEREA